MIHQPAKELHCQVLEGERRTVKQLEHEVVHAELHERGDRRVTEVAVGLARHAGEIVRGNGVADERADHVDRDFGVRAPGKARDLPGV